MKKFFTVLIVMLSLTFSIFIQINFLNVVPMFGVAANLGIVVIAGFGLMNGQLIGGITGMFYGMMIDFTFSKTIGINILLYALLGIITGKTSAKFSKDNKTAMVMIVVVSTFIFEFASYLILSWLYGSDVSIIKAIIIIIVEAAYNLLLTVMLHKTIAAIGELINRTKNSYYLL